MTHPLTTQETRVNEPYSLTEDQQNPQPPSLLAALFGVDIMGASAMYPTAADPPRELTELERVQRQLASREEALVRIAGIYPPDGKSFGPYDAENAVVIARQELGLPLRAVVSEPSEMERRVLAEIGYKSMPAPDVVAAAYRALWLDAFKPQGTPIRWYHRLWWRLLALVGRGK